MSWLPLRKSVADLTRRAQLSHSATPRDLEALGRVETDTPLSQWTDKLCQAVYEGTRRYRGLRPFDPADAELLARVVALLKRWLTGTHQGAVCLSHLDYYLDEFAFRFNRRTSRLRGKLFYRLFKRADVESLLRCIEASK